MLNPEQKSWGLDELENAVEVVNSIKDLLVWTPMEVPTTSETQDVVILDALDAYKADLESAIKELTNDC